MIDNPVACFYNEGDGSPESELSCQAKGEHHIMSHFSMQGIKGVIPAMITPFDESEGLDLARTRALTRYLCSRPIGGLYLTGSTGEGFLLTGEERKAFVETVIDEVAGRVPVIVHVGAISTRMSEDMARHAAQAGADAISSVPPIYWRFSDDEVAAYYADLVQASGLPMIVYNIALAGLVSFDMVKRLGSIDGVEGIKYTSSTLYDVFRIKEALGEDFKVYSGSDELAVSGLAFGADGIIGSTYNVLSDLFIALDAQMAQGDVVAARRTQKAANSLIFTLLKHNLMPALKATLTMGGVDCGRCRRPFAHLSDAQVEALKDDYRAVKAEMGDMGLDFMKNL